jgi:hypothetical protein
MRRLYFRMMNMIFNMITESLEARTPERGPWCTDCRQPVRLAPSAGWVHILGGQDHPAEPDRT